MKKNIFILSIIIISLSLTSCTRNNAADPERPPEEIHISYNNANSLSNITSLQEPAGIAYMEGHILVTSRTDNSIMIFDLSGKHMKTIGRIGNGPLEFINPNGIATHDGNIYVVDSGNNRIQILNSKYEYIDSLALETLSQGNRSDYTDIALDSMGNIYLTTNSLFAEKAKVYIVKGDDITTTSQSLYGYLFADEDGIYAVNTQSLYEKEDYFGAITGMSSFYKIQNDELVEKFKFPFKYGPTDFVIKDGYIYVLSCVWARLDKWSLDGEYQETLCKFEQLSPHSFLSITSDGFWVADKMNDSIYVVSLGE